MRSTTWFIRPAAGLALWAGLAASPLGARPAHAGDFAGLVEVRVDLRVVGSGDDANGVSGRSPLSGVDVRLFVRQGPPTSAADLPEEFDQGLSVDAAKTDADGLCVLAAPVDAIVEVILRWHDPETKMFVYSGHAVGRVEGTAHVNAHVIKVIHSDGSVLYSGGKTQVVTG
jgi:hypothetical protein